MVSHLTNKSNIIILPPFSSFFRALKHYVWLESSAWFTPSGLIHRREGLALKCLLWKHFRQWFWKLSFDNFTPWFLPAICEASWYLLFSYCEHTQTLAPSSGLGPAWRSWYKYDFFKSGIFVFKKPEFVDSWKNWSTACSFRKLPPDLCWRIRYDEEGNIYDHFIIYMIMSYDVPRHLQLISDAWSFL